MSEFTIAIADKKIHVSSIYPHVERVCENYLAPGAQPDIYVTTDRKDIDAERALAEESGYSEGYLESSAVHRKICSAMAEFNAFMMHGAVAAVENKAYMFTAPSGTGKSTHVKLWLENVPGSYIVNGDKPMIIMKNGAAFACGTPWCGKERMEKNTSVPLKAVVLLRRGERNEIRKVSPADYIPDIIRQIHRPAERDAAVKVVALSEKLINTVSFYELHCNMEPEAAETAWNVLRCL